MRQIASCAYISSCHKTKTLVDIGSPVDIKNIEIDVLQDAEETWERQCGFFSADERPVGKDQLRNLNGIYQVAKNCTILSFVALSKNLTLQD